MKTMHKLKSLVAIAGVVALALSSQGATKKIGDYIWTYTTVKGGVQIGDGENVAVVSCCSPSPVSGTLTIPSKIGKLAVKSIGNRAFSGCEGLETVKIPNGVTSIGQYAFNGCKGLKWVTVPASVKSIGMSAFYQCSSLESVSIPKGVTSIQPYTFFECTSLRNVSIPTTVKTIGNYAFYRCSSLVTASLAYVENIGPYAFACSAAVNVGTKANIGEYAFYNCGVLQSAVLLSGTSVIGNGAFEGCTSFEKLWVSQSLSTIGSSAFDSVPLNEIHYDFEGDDERFKGLLVGSGMSAAMANAINFVLECKLTVKSNNAKYGTAAILDDGDSYTSSRWIAGEEAVLLAKPKKGYVFAGWYQDKALKKPLNCDFFWDCSSDYRAKRLSIRMPRKHTTIYARFITKAVAKKSLKFTAATKKLAKTAMVGSPEKSVAIKVAASSATLVTLSAKGLPKGLTFDAAAGMIMGAPTVPGTHSITITAKDAAGNKITQKVKISAEVMSWSCGTYYGRASVDSSSVPAIATCTVAKTGKVTGKIYYKDKAYSFTSKCSSSTEEATKFSVKVKIGSKTFSTGTVATFKAGTEFPVVCAESAGNTFIVQKHPGLIKAGGALEKYIGKVFTVTGSFEGSASWGLKKSSDKLTFKVVSGDLVQVSGTVNGAKIAIAAPLRLIYNTLDRSSDAGVIKEFDEGVEYTTYRLYADLVALKGKYFHPLIVEVMVDSTGSIQLESWRVVQ